jgi:hypothetical protein
MRQLLLGMIALSLSGCSMVPYYSQLKAVADTGIVTGIEDRKHFNDMKAATIQSALGDISVGAYWRNFTTEQQCAIKVLVQGSSEGCNASLDRLTKVLEQLSPLVRTE